jgi:diadenosine tetraphosphate (Ap4A) HIT family hydrolase
MTHPGTRPAGECLACDLTTGVKALPGGTIFRTDAWTVEHCIGPLGLGTLVVKPIRHVLHVADLTMAESAELGPLLTRVSQAVTSLLNPEQVYVCLWSHAGGTPRHIHFVVQPVTSEVMSGRETYGPALQMAMFDSGVIPAVNEVRDLCESLALELNRQTEAPPRT